MRSTWIALAVCAGAVAGFMWGTAKPTEAAMVVGFSKANMTLVETAARKKRPRVQCTDYLLWTCCKEAGKEESCKFKVM